MRSRTHLDIADISIKVLILISAANRSILKSHLEQIRLSSLDNWHRFFQSETVKHRQIPTFAHLQICAMNSAKPLSAPLRGLASSARPPMPPFTRETALQKVRMAEDAWNSRNPEKVALAYTEDSEWRNRSEFIKGREEIVEFLKRKWEKEQQYRLIKGLWAFEGNRIAARFAYEWWDGKEWWRSYGNENWEFDERGLMKRRIASINDVKIGEEGRLFKWEQGKRPEGVPELEEHGL